MTFYEKFLYELLTKNIVERKALATLGACRQMIDRVIRRSIHEGLIEQTVHSVTLNRRKKKMEFFSLTPYGYLLAIKKLEDCVPWVRYLEPFYGIQIFGLKYSKARIAARYIRVSTTAMMADMIGARENTLFVIEYAGEQQNENDSATSDPFDDADTYDPDATGESVWQMIESGAFTEEALQDIEDYYADLELDIRETSCEELYPAEYMIKPIDGEMVGEDLDYEEDGSIQNYLLADLVNCALRKYYLKAENKYDVSFIDAMTIKRTIETVAIRNNTTPPDLRAGRYTGVIISPEKITMTYHASELMPLLWRRRFRQRETAAYGGARRLFGSGTHRDNSKCAVLLVVDLNAFAASYNPYEAKVVTGNKKDIENLGNGFNHFWIVPMDAEGVAELQKVTCCNCEAETEQIAAKLIAEGEYSKSTSRVAGTFPLYDDFDEVHASIVPHIDVIQLRHIKATMLRFPQLNYAVLCHRWQIPYMRIVLGSDIDIRPLPSTYSGNNPTLQMAAEKEAQASQ